MGKKNTHLYNPTFAKHQLNELNPPLTHPGNDPFHDGHDLLPVQFRWDPDSSTTRSYNLEQDPLGPERAGRQGASWDGRGQKASLDSSINTGEAGAPTFNFNPNRNLERVLRLEP